MKLQLNITHIFDGIKTDLSYNLNDLRQVTNEDTKTIYITVNDGKVAKIEFNKIEKIVKESENLFRSTCIIEFEEKHILSKHNIDNNWAGEHMILYKDHTFEYATHGSGRPIIGIYVGTYKFI